jgi:hypothetical protein
MGNGCLTSGWRLSEETEKRKMRVSGLGRRNEASSPRGTIEQNEKLNLVAQFGGDWMRSEKDRANPKIW